MTTKQIDYCIELAHTLNFSRAAENMFVSQPTFSYQLKLLEEEIGFKIFERNGKGAALTPAGEQFVSYLVNMREEMKRAIEQGQNFSAKYSDNISVSMMVRQALCFLPEAIRTFEKEQPGVRVTPVFQYDNGIESFLKGDVDVLFALIEQTKHIPGINVHKLFDSHIYLITDKNDPLAEKNLITESDLYGRTLMVGGGSPNALRTIQQRLVSSGIIDYFNSPDHDTTFCKMHGGKHMPHFSHAGISISSSFNDLHHQKGQAEFFIFSFAD